MPPKANKRSRKLASRQGKGKKVADPPLAIMSHQERMRASWMPKNCGLKNLGNTCYMNAGLQCLLHTTELSHFFLQGFYQQDLNAVKALGCKAKLAQSFNLLVDQSHSHNHGGNGDLEQSVVNPYFMKRTIGEFNAVFKNYRQHDSQELLGSLLNGIHEDLNRMKDKPYVENVVGDGKTDAADAQDAWDGYKSRNDSFVVDTFQSQTRSRLRCLECENMSVSFDTSMYLSVAVPTDEPQPTALDDMLRAYSEEERLTDSNQWRSVHGGACGRRAHC